MPNNRPSRSMFASLPPELKLALRTQTVEPFLHDTVEVKSELLDIMETDGLLRTQPAESGSESPVKIDIRQEIIEVDIPLAPITLAPVISSSSVVLKRREDLTPGRPSRGAGEWYEHGEDTPGASRSRQKKKKGKTRAVKNVHLGHPWDCTGLVPRYTDYSDAPPELSKYFAQRHLLLPKYDFVPLLLDDTGWFSITPQPIAAQIADRCACDVIVDAFCGVGGNAIEFARTCERVIAIDNDPVRLRLARHNALHLGVADRIEFILGDYTEWARSWIGGRPKGGTAAIDVVFLSPPWGGIDYLNMSTNSRPTPNPTYSLFTIQPIHGADLFTLSASLTPNIAYYLPKNTNLHELSELANTLDTPMMDCGADGTMRKRSREWVEVEEEWVGDKLKAVTAYFGGLVAE